MVKSIQFRKGVLSLTVATGRAATRAQGERCIELDLGEGRTISEFHRSQLVDFLDPFHSKRAHEIGDLIIELLNAHARVCWINLDLLNSPGVRLQDSGAPNVLIEFTSGTAERASRQEYIPLSFGEGGFD